MNNKDDQQRIIDQIIENIINIGNSYKFEPMPSYKSAIIHIWIPSMHSEIEYIEPDENHKVGIGYIEVHTEPEIEGIIIDLIDERSTTSPNDVGSSDSEMGSTLTNDAEGEDIV